ncbi:MAG: histidine triad nucleotide-binding protein [Clostridia bacterium]|nr:histidine triad nucleotide-binding protein [Clostridia bacterium]
MSDCIFCKIANKEINSELIYENDNIVAFKDLNPRAKMHFLIIPKKHYDTILDIDDTKIMQDIFKAVKEIAKKYNIDEKGFRLINNCKEDGGQEVMHMHIHMLAGEKLKTTII